MSEQETYPTDRALAEQRAEQASLAHHGPQPGRVQSYDAATQTADVVPLLRAPVPQPDGSYTTEELPIIPSCPVLTLRVAGWMFALKVEPGTEGLLIPTDGAIGHWRTGDGDVTDPGDLRRHHIQSSVFVPGLTTRAKALAHAPTGDTMLVMGSDADGGTRLAMKVDGSVVITQGAAVVAQIDADGTVHIGGAAGQFVALANLVSARLTTIQAAFDGHTHVVTGTTASAGSPIVATVAVPAAIGPLDSVAATKAKAT